MGDTFYFSDVCWRGWPCGSFGWSGSQIRIGAPVPYIALMPCSGGRERAPLWGWGLDCRAKHGRWSSELERSPYWCEDGR